MAKGIKVGLLVNHLNLPAGVSPILDVPGIDFTVIEYPQPAVKGNLFGRGVVKVVALAERWVFGIRSQTVDVSHLPRIQIRPTGKMVLRATPADLEALKGFDLLLRVGVGIWKGAILKTPILSFHHGDNRVNRGGPAAFWETFHRWPRTGYILQRLTEELDGGQVLKRGWVATRPFYTLNWRAVEGQSALALVDLLTEYAATRTLPPAEAGHIYDGQIHTSPRAADAIRYALKSAYRLFKRCRRRATKKPLWGLSVVRQNFLTMALRRRQPLNAPPGRCWADPFLWRHEGETYCLVEEACLKTGLGRITALRMGDDGAIQNLGTALEEPFHLSFPFLFDHEGRTYMVPETGAEGEVKIYTTDSFPLGWRQAGTLLKGRAADTMVFDHEGLWYMLTTLDRAGADSSVELALYVSESPLSGWSVHPGSPLMVNPFGGRNAGMTKRDGTIYRFAQKQGFDRYGEGLMIFKVTTLSPTQYEEILVDEIQPNFDPGICGVHHMTVLDDLTVIDHLRYV